MYLLYLYYCYYFFLFFFFYFIFFFSSRRRHTRWPRDWSSDVCSSDLPFAQRGAEKYDNPIPSREYILSLLDAADGPGTHPELCEQLKLTDDDSVEPLRRRLIAMARDGRLLSRRRGAEVRVANIDGARGPVQ